MLFASILAAALSLPLLSSATLVITQPTGAGWVGNSTVTIAWSWDINDPTFSIELVNPTVHEGVLINGPYAVANNVNPNRNSVSFALPDVPAGDGYTVQFVAIANIGSVFATSPDFPVLENAGSSSVAQPTSTNGSKRPTPSASSSRVPVNVTVTSSGTATASGATNASSSPTATPTYASYTLLNPSAASSSTSSSSVAPAAGNGAFSTLSLSGSLAGLVALAWSVAVIA